MLRARLGQHFLIDNSVARRIVDAVDISAGDLITEIGPGTGSLTRYLVPAVLKAGARVLLVELDEHLASELERRYAKTDTATVVRGDARELDLMNSFGDDVSRYKVVGNLPYYAGTPIVRRFLESDTPPDSMVVMLQREVAMDMVAPPGQMSLLSLAVQIYASGRVLFTVEPSAFRPRPEVRSSVVQIIPHASPRVGPEMREAMFEVARACFRGKRKQLHNSLAHGLGLSVDESKVLGRDAGIDTRRRPATLTVDEWIGLASTWMELTSIRDATGI